MHHRDSHQPAYPFGINIATRKLETLNCFSEQRLVDTDLLTLIHFLIMHNIVTLRVEKGGNVFFFLLFPLAFVSLQSNYRVRHRYYYIEY